MGIAGTAVAGVTGAKLVISLLRLWDTPLAGSPAMTPRDAYRADRLRTILIGAVVSMGPAVRVSIAEVVLMVQGRGRVQFLPLLETALKREVLRQAGAVYQFTHAALQDHLAMLGRTKTGQQVQRQ